MHIIKECKYGASPEEPCAGENLDIIAVDFAMKNNIPVRDAMRWLKHISGKDGRIEGCIKYGDGTPNMCQVCAALLVLPLPSRKIALQ